MKESITEAGKLIKAGADFRKLRQAIRCFQLLEEKGFEDLESIGTELFGPQAGSYQSRVSRLLDLLHDTLNLEWNTLCTRKGGKHPRYTDAGRVFLGGPAQEILAEIDRCEAGLLQALRGAREKVQKGECYRMPVAPAMDGKWLLAFQTTLQQSEATRHIDLNRVEVTLISAEVERAVRNGKHELGVLQLPRDPRARLELNQHHEATVLFMEPFVAVMHEDHPLAHKKKKLFLTDFAGVRGYRHYDGGRPAEDVDRAFKEAGVTVSREQVFHKFSTVESVLKANPDQPGITIVPRLFLTIDHIFDAPEVLPERPFPKIITRRIVDFVTLREMGFIRCKGKVSPTGELVLAALRQEAKKFSVSQNARSTASER